MPSTIQTINPAAMLSMKQVLELVPISHTQVYRMMQKGEFPKSVNVGGRRVAWLQCDILKWATALTADD